MTFICSVWLLLNIDLQVKNIRGQSNVYADSLSRWRVYQNLQIPDVRILKTCQ